MKQLTVLTLIAALCFGYFFTNPSDVYAADTGFKTTGTVEASGNWSNFTTTRLNTSDNSRAACNNSSNCNAAIASEDGQVSDFNFGIPAGATIDGIEIQFEAACLGSDFWCNSGTDSIQAALSWDDASSWTSVKQTGDVPPAEDTYTLGGPTDTWGRTWSASELADGTFQASIGAQCASGCGFGGHGIHIDLLEIKVYYTASSFEDGHWISPSLDVGAITNVDDSIIEWATSTPSDTDVIFKTALNSSASTPPSEGDFDTVTNGGKLQSGSSGGDISGSLSGQYLWVRIELYASTDGNDTPFVHWYRVGINNADAGTRRIINVH